MADHDQHVMTPEDEELRLECVRLAMAFSEGDPIENAKRLFRYIKEGPEA